MKLLDATIYGFGKYYQRHFSFQDGIHVIYGPNEAGKSTLHSFLGCMLFGLERGRGRAARTDLYTRYLPWDHDATYGGSLTLETEEQPCHLQRNFRSEHRSCLLTTPGCSPAPIDDRTLALNYYEGLTEALYYNTISIRQMRVAPDNSLAEELTLRLQEFRQTGSDGIRCSCALSWLKAEKKRKEAQLTPDLEKKQNQARQSLEALRHRLDNMELPKQKATLEQDMDSCLERLEQLAHLSPGPAFKEDPDDSDGPAADTNVPSSSKRRRSSLLFFLLFLATLSGAVFFRQSSRFTAALILGLFALIFLLCTIGTLRKNRVLPPSHDEDEEETFCDPEEIEHLRLRLRTLQEQYKTVCRQEWEYERLLEQAQALEEEWEQLTALVRQEESIRLEIQAITLALTTLQKLSTQMRNHIGPQLNETMSHILSGLTDGAYSQVFMDDQLHITIGTGTRVVPLESLSRGTIEQIWLAMRLAVIDLLFPHGGMPLLLDDCFLAYDDDRLAGTLTWLAEHYPGQIFLFTCQKREAALLAQERIPFTKIML